MNNTKLAMVVSVAAYFLLNSRQSGSQTLEELTGIDPENLERFDTWTGEDRSEITQVMYKDGSERLYMSDALGQRVVLERKPFSHSYEVTPATLLNESFEGQGVDSQGLQLFAQLVGVGKAYEKMRKPQQIYDQPNFTILDGDSGPSYKGPYPYAAADC
ncbi:hypothetical protein JXB41_08430 [Candidatus Woesearchaeota archaeon]|nr:hypothetical protein [Candidatus Woesearchaeota archaeon]